MKIAIVRKTSLTTRIPFSKDIEMTQDYIDEFLRLGRNGYLVVPLYLVHMYHQRRKCDYYHEKGVFLWDFAAGISLVKEAGGSVNFWQDR